MRHIIFAFLAVFLLISCAKENKMEDTDHNLQTRSELTPEQGFASFLTIADGNYNPPYYDLITMGTSGINAD